MAATLACGKAARRAAAEPRPQRPRGVTGGHVRCTGDHAVHARLRAACGNGGGGSGGSHRGHHEGADGGTPTGRAGGAPPARAAAARGCAATASRAAAAGTAARRERQRAAAAADGGRRAAPGGRTASPLANRRRGVAAHGRPYRGRPQGVRHGGCWGEARRWGRGFAAWADAERRVQSL